MPEHNLGVYLDKILGRGYVNTDTNDQENLGRLDNNFKEQTGRGSPEARKPHNDLEDYLKTKWSEKTASVVDKRIAQMEELTSDLEDQALIVRLKAKDRFVTGTGLDNPLNVGFATDWTTGWPYVPGSGLKGMTRAWVEHWATEEDLQKHNGPGWSAEDAFFSIFGAPSDEDGDGWAGEIIFLDGVFAPLANDENIVELDVMTPHYNRRHNEKNWVPADWNDPIPIPYLTVKPGVTLVTGLIARDPIGAPLLPIAKAWLMRAVAEIGLGAKTKDGKGRFAEVTP